MNEKTLFVAYRVEESSFRLRPVKEKEKFTLAPRFSCTIKGSEKEFNAYVTAELGGDNAAPAPFDLKATVSGKFITGVDTAGDKKSQLKLALQTLFPYLRAFVSTLTSASGLPPFILPFVDVDAFIEGATKKDSTVYN